VFKRLFVHVMHINASVTPSSMNSMPVGAYIAFCVCAPCFLVCAHVNQSKFKTCVCAHTCTA